jgi:hypothetical protein
MLASENKIKTNVWYLCNYDRTPAARHHQKFDLIRALQLPRGPGALLRSDVAMKMLIACQEGKETHTTTIPYNTPHDVLEGLQDDGWEVEKPWFWGLWSREIRVKSSGGRM